MPTPKRAAKAKRRSSKRQTSEKRSSRVKKLEPVRPSSAEVRLEQEQMAEVFSIGHRPQKTLSASDGELLKTFQANLLSLISHELRTPLTGILNSLSLLEGSENDSDFTALELISMARRNAQRLNNTLAMLLDLAAIESGSFQAKLREVSLSNLVRTRARSYAMEIQGLGLELRLTEKEKTGVSSPVLADPQKLGRAIELCLFSMIPRAESGSEVEIEITSRSIRFVYQLKSGHFEEFESAWTQALAGHQGGVLTPGSAFRETLQTEQGFLTRTQEGLGSELLLVHEIMRVHQGQLRREVDDHEVALIMELPELSSMEALCSVLGSRVYLSSTGVGTVALGLIRVPEDETIDRFRTKMRGCLFRATDAIYSLPERNQLALVMDDCKLEDVPRIIGRIERAMGRPLKVGIVSCPEEASDPEILIDLAQKRIE